jgi:hypothetical protein
MSFVLPATPAEAGSLVIPAWAFARGNGRVHADPDKYADAGPVVGGGPERPSGWTLEYDVNVPVTGKYSLHICYAAAEPRPIEIFVNGENLGTYCRSVTFDKSDKLTWNSSGARWEAVVPQKQVHRSYTYVFDLLKLSAEETHSVVLTSRRPLPHLVALRLDLPEAFPDNWSPPPYKVRDLDSIPVAHRKAFVPANVDVAELRQPVKPPPRPGVAASLTIPAWTFDRGNVRIFASPDRYATAGPLVGNEARQAGDGMVEYDIDFPVTAEYMLQVQYASAEARPVDVLLDGKKLGKGCTSVTLGSPPFVKPFTFSSNSKEAKWEQVSKGGRPIKLSITRGKHTLRFARRGPLPNLVALRLDSLTAFPKGWRQPLRKVKHFDRVPVTQRSVLLPPGAVNIAALRMAIEDVIAEFGPEYPGGQQYLKQLADFEKRPHTVFVAPGHGPLAHTRVWAREVKVPMEKRTTEDALAKLRRDAMLAHPALRFDKLLFVTRPPYKAHHIYEDQDANDMGGNLCVLSPVTPDGKVTELVPELNGGLFSRFDLSYDAKRIVFGYKKKNKAFRIYEIDIDPAAGKMVSGSLRQLTFGSAEEDEAVRLCSWQGRGIARGFQDMDPCYLPGGRILFASTRSMKNTFCGATTVTTLYVMDADGKNMRCLSAGPINEIAPCVLDDGRVVYTRWEYLDKGVGNGQSVWAIRPDGSGVDHVYKNNTVLPAAMINTRSIPGSRRLITVGAPHMELSVGPVILVDTRQSRRTPDAMTCITPEVGYPCMDQFGRGQNNHGYFKEPYAFSEKFFLVSHGPSLRGAGYGIYMLDAWGNRARLYRTTRSCFQPIPLRPRRKPTQVAPVAGADNAITARAGAMPKETGTLFIQDVYRGLTGIERGRVKYVRVTGALPWPWSQNGMRTVGLNADIHRKRIHGVARVHEDGSAFFTAPASESIFFQALDENFMALQKMPTFINLMPGEQRSCIGCHEPRRDAPSAVAARALALNFPPQALRPQPGDTGVRMVHYDADVEPVFSKRCADCHGGAKPKGRLDLTRVLTGTYSRSYESLLRAELISYSDCRFGRALFEPAPPLTHGSHRSKLVERILREPCKGALTREEFIKIVTWIDCNVPYYGTYKGKRDLKHKDDPDFRPTPLAASE